MIICLPIADRRAVRGRTSALEELCRVAHIPTTAAHIAGSSPRVEPLHRHLRARIRAPADSTLETYARHRVRRRPPAALARDSAGPAQQGRDIDLPASTLAAETSPAERGLQQSENPPA